MPDKDDYEKIISFGILADKLKTVKRQNFKFGEENENSAEHSWHIAVLLILLKDEFKDLDFEKVISLALIHDIPEIINGDFCPFDTENYKEAKKENQKRQKNYILSCQKRLLRDSNHFKTNMTIPCQKKQKS